ncbi:MAG: aminotransferase class I/II-fold pyridoxal phosphate-dependent enzyme, partial [Candidatus Sumerlaeota bacterium]|nr:aminotransferase class I/II-fold pyridoxal phosphate-dependent enzyme [Candidatus Sumerlaeota bacterium]
VAYAPMAMLAGAKPVILETAAKDGFRIRPAAVAALVTERTKAIVLNYPCNPTGATLDRAAIEAIAAIAKREDIIVLSDEVYAELTYDGEHVAFASVPGVRKQCVLLSGFSKAWAMTGWRAGYLAGPPDLIAAACKIHQYSMLSCPIMAQYAAIEALRHGDKDMREMIDTYNQRRRIIVDGLNSLGLECHMPAGAFYAFPSIKKTGLSSVEFCKRLVKEEKVAIVPGNAFGPCGEGHVRCAYAASFEAIEKALEGIGRLLRRI